MYRTLPFPHHLNHSLRHHICRTIYEPTEKKHYLCIAKNKLVGQYLLQDNTKPAWHTDKRSIPERVQDAVDEMVMKVDEMAVTNR